VIEFPRRFLHQQKTWENFSTLATFRTLLFVSQYWPHIKFLNKLNSELFQLVINVDCIRADGLWRLQGNLLFFWEISLNRNWRGCEAFGFSLDR
jgi:hypothetical protein